MLAVELAVPVDGIAGRGRSTSVRAFKKAIAPLRSSRITLNCREVLSYAARQRRGGSPGLPVIVRSLIGFDYKNVGNRQIFFQCYFISSGDWAIAPVPVDDL